MKMKMIHSKTTRTGKNDESADDAAVVEAAAPDLRSAPKAKIPCFLEDLRQASSGEAERPRRPRVSREIAELTRAAGNTGATP